MPKKEKDQNAFALLKADHQKVKELFEEFEDSDNQEKKREIAQEAIKELKIHTTVEEELFYPQVREQLEEDESIMDEAQEEHHVAKLLIRELEELTGSDEQFNAKFTVLAENVRHHIKEEEGEMFPEAKKTDVDFDELGAQLLRRKQELMDENPQEEKATASASD